MIVFQTERLIFSEFTYDDVAFIVRITNTEGWLKYIGDRNTKTEEGAIEYLNKGPISSYAKTGYGLWKVSLKTTNEPIGICGVFNRNIFEHPDIGYAILPEHEGKGYASEATIGTVNYAVNDLGLPNLVGIVDLDNYRSIALLEKIGMSYRKNIVLPGETTELKLYSLNPL
jgi:RimJ/RimL family protein N-acetyltransferase